MTRNDSYKILIYRLDCNAVKFKNPDELKMNTEVKVECFQKIIKWAKID
jgi:hypothetical protein